MDANTQVKPARIYYIDWLRIGAVLLLIPFHTARIFDIWDPFYVKSAATSSLLSYGIVAFLNQWQLPLLFLLAGASTWFALEHRSGSQYRRERFTRLLIPFLFGLLVIVPPQAYLARMQTPGYSAGYLRFLRDYLNVRGDLTGYTGLFTPGHLWFILFLFVFAWLALPLLIRLKHSAGQALVARLAASSEKPLGLLWFLPPLVVAGALPALGGENAFLYFTLFVYGFVLMADPRFQVSIERARWPALALALITTAGLTWLGLMNLPTPKYSWGDILSFLLRTLNTWSWLVAILGFGRRHLNRSGPALRYATEGSYPFYILHQTVIVLIGFFVVQWNAGIGEKFLVIASASLAATLLIYDLAVRRFNIFRFLFGMKPLPSRDVPLLKGQPAPTHPPRSAQL